MQIRKLAEVEKEMILAAMTEFGDPVKAARALGIGKTTMYRRLRYFGWKGDLRKAGNQDFYDMELLLRAEVLARIPVPSQLPWKQPPKLLVLPSTPFEKELANLRCPACRTVVLLEAR